MSPRQKARVTRMAIGGGALLALVAFGLWLVAGRASATAAGGWAEVRR